ncbi:low-density lipoprotein receptor-related protein 4-like [Lingula anatina]|uniref:Low-density lipoprotein receptor-related protein 4-like n=1 Tax=Lingula anatina TaxID=7574 RepID=A0A1S3IBV4_LINAN|nr:low-density lipoprotein receptor-related protein 4-like [Lingula anatina]|eukprot:XP_013395341.1 low-density lipoprotein receptor-related protein 4-like [Lingula anatina]
MDFRKIQLPHPLLSVLFFSTPDPPTCGADQFKCSNGKCIRQDWICDGDNDCDDRSDEISCEHKNCTSDQFRCQNGNCVRQHWRCDGDDDCGDNSDEICPEHQTCHPNEFRCSDGTCISSTWRCDFDEDCKGGEDEHDCTVSPHNCTKDEFLCPETGRCILHSYRCDGENDCGDWSDEKCDSRPSCGDGEFQCSSGMCINGAWECDGEYDCPDNSDELHCPSPSCGLGQFQCVSGLCIRDIWRCDGEKDCSDNSDEVGCVYNNTHCGKGQFRCDNGQCIGSSKVCDGEDQCGDGSDEKKCISPASCSADNGGCTQKCTNTRMGARCTCNVGYDLMMDKKSCIDVNECEIEGSCSQLCHNTMGSFRCSCTRGYELKPDGKGCKALGGEAYLIFANRVDIRKVLPDKSEYTSILAGLENAIALDFHHDLGMVFWSDVTLDKIKRAYINGTDVQDIVDTGLESPGGVAVDWIHNKLFWTDSGTSRVEVANLDGSQRKVLLWENLEKPRAIAAHPGQGTIFWTDWGQRPKIERSTMDGSSRDILAEENLFWPNGLAIDYAADRIYWADAKHHVIECADLDGANRRIVLDQGLPHPFAVTLFEDELYWTDWHTKSIKKANKFNGNSVVTVRNRLHFPMDIHTFHPLRQPTAVNRCGMNNGGCSHLCLPNLDTYSCGCLTGYRLLPDNRSCAQEIEKFLLFSHQSDIRRISFDTEDKTDIVVPLSNVQGALALDWDSQDKYIYWTDVKMETINRALWDGSYDEIIVGSSLESPAGLALDWVTRKLYWTDAGTDMIEVSNLDGTMRTVLVWEDLDKPRDIIVDPASGYMYWTDWGRLPKIERAGMDGQNRSILVSQNLTWPNGLAIDVQSRRLYWVDAGHHVIEHADLDGSNRKILLASEVPHPFGLTVFEDNIYWTDWQTKSIHVANKLTGGNRSVLVQGLDNLMDIHVYHKGRTMIPNACMVNNGGCSHLCLLAPPPSTHTCMCPTGIHLLPDGKTCQPELNQYIIFARKTDIRLISLDVPYYADVVLPIEGLKNTIALDVDTQEGKVYWADIGLDKIQRSNLDGSDVEDVLTQGLKTMDGISLDTVGRKIYWTDTGRNRIEVANLDGSMRKVLFWQNIDNPRAIVVDHNTGYMFWADWGSDPVIERADMDGENRQVLVTDNLGWPNGLALDTENAKIYWADAKTEMLECSNLDGSNRKIVVSGLPHPYGLTILNDHVYWTDWQAKAIKRANKLTGVDVTVIRENMPGLMDLHGVQKTEQKGTSRCGSYNGGCSHLCLPNPGGFSCACPTGILLKPDGKTCYNVPTTYMLFASRDSIQRISMDTPDSTEVFLPLPDLSNVIALDVDYADQKLYYTDVHLDVIRYMFWTDWGNTPKIERAFMDGTNRRVLVNTELGWPNGLALDYEMERIFWLDAKLDKIETSDLNGENRVLLISGTQGVLDHPFGITVFGEHVYWTDWQTQSIDRANKRTGKNRTVIKDNLEGLMDVLIVSPLKQSGTNACHMNNGGCSHLCLARPDVGFVCACPTEPDDRPCSTVPGIYIVDPTKNKKFDYGKEWNVPPAIPDTLPDTGQHADGCSEEDWRHGLCSADNSGVHAAYISLAVVILLILGGAVIFLLIWRRKRRREEDSISSEARLTFSNPTYHKTSDERINIERRTKPWRLFRYDTAEERLSMLAPPVPPKPKENLASQEAAALMKAKDSDCDCEGCETPPPTPPERIDSKNIFIQDEVKDSKDPRLEDDTYEPVETQI